MDTEHDDLSTLVWLDGNPNDITTEQIEAKKQELQTRTNERKKELAKLEETIRFH